VFVGQRTRRHWHIDYLGTHCRALAVHFAIAHQSAEGRWAAVMNDCPEASIPVPGFGATDTADRAHLWYLHGAGAWNWLPRSAGERVFTFRVGESGDRSGPGFGQQE
jgi:Uri superfamily endonuclease